MSSETPHAPVDFNPETAARDATLRHWRRVQVFGGMTLACCIFLPAVEGCNEWIVPAGEAWEVIDNIQHAKSVTGLVGGIALFSSAYVLGIWSAISAMRLQTAERSQPRRSFWFAKAPLAFCAVSAFFIQAIAVNGTPKITRLPNTTGRLTILILTILTLFYLLRNRAVGPLATLAAHWWCGLMCASWFVLWTLLGAMIGVHLALLGSILVVVSTFEQARALSELSRLRLLFRLLVAGNIWVHDPTVCVQCGYDLRGLPQPRCPECGTPFTPVDALH